MYTIRSTGTPQETANEKKNLQHNANHHLALKPKNLSQKKYGQIKRLFAFVFYKIKVICIRLL